MFFGGGWWGVSSSIAMPRMPRKFTFNISTCHLTHRGLYHDLGCETEKKATQMSLDMPWGYRGSQPKPSNQPHWVGGYIHPPIVSMFSFVTMSDFSHLGMSKLREEASSIKLRATSSVKVDLKDIHLPSETTTNRTTTRKNTCESGK